jgi:tripartite ATP-independent transporter DctP family solute receptor
MQKSKIFNKLLLLLLVLLFISGCSNKNEDYRVSNQNKIILRLAETRSPNYPSSQGAKEFAKLVEQKSAGRIKVMVYDSGRLGDEISVIEQVQFGGIDLARVSVASLVRYSPKAKIMTLPYLFKNSVHMWQVLSGPVGNDLIESLLKEKITCLTWYEAGTQGFYNSKRPINSIDDIKGLKISAQQSQVSIDWYLYLGASLVSTKASDLYSALQARSIDGVEDNIIAYYLSRHYEVAPFFTYDEHARIPDMIIASRGTMLHLSQNDRAIIEQAAKESAIIQKQAWFEMEKEVLKHLHDFGVNIVYTNYQSSESFLSAVEPIYNSFKKEDLATIINLN